MTNSSLKRAIPLVLTSGLILSACTTHSDLPDPHEALTAQQVQGRAPLILKVAITSTTTEQQLRREHPGSRLLATYPDQGYALLSSPSQRSPRAILAVEQNREVELPAISAGIPIQGGGYTSWAGGYTSWAGGYTSWAGGTTTPTTLTENQNTWSLLRLSNAQHLVPELGQGVKVAVIDTGIDLRHSAFQNRIDFTNAHDYIDRDTTPQEVNGAITGYSKGYGHGTSVAGLVLQIAPKATILPIRVLKSDGSGDLDNVILAVNHALTSGARIINLSLGAYQDSPSLNTILATAVSRGVIIVTASGNTGDSNIMFPARRAFDYSTQSNWVPLGTGLLSVASVKYANGGYWKSSFSTYGTQIKLSAPGENLWGPFPGGMKSYFSGTSAAAPLVSGAVALVLSTGVRSSPQTLTENVTNATQPIADWQYAGMLGRGVLDIEKLVRYYR